MRAEDLLLAWDPLGYGVGSYGPEFDDIAVALTEVETEEDLSERIRHILMEAFDECPTDSDLRDMARRLLASSQSCQL